MGGDRGGSSSPSSPSRLVTDFLEAVVRRDLDAALALVTDDVEYDNVPIGKVFGPAGLRGVLSGGLTASAERLDWIVYRQAATGAWVCNERLDRFLVGGRWVEVPVAGVFELREGRIALWRDYFDKETFVRQMAAGEAEVDR